MLEKFLQRKLFVIQDGILKAYKGNDLITQISIPEGVTVIGSYVFRQCRELEKVTFPSTLKRIEERAFYHCSGLERLDFPEGLECIGLEAFCDCSNVKVITFPDSLHQVDGRAFRHCYPYTVIFQNGNSFSLKDFAAKIDNIHDSKTLWTMLLGRAFYLHYEETGLRNRLILEYAIASGIPTAWEYLRSEFTDICMSFIDDGDAETFFRYLEYVPGLTQENIDILSEYAIAMAEVTGNIEIQIYLLHYKAEHFDYIDLSERFQL